MFRLIIALGVATLLLPAEAIQTSNKQQTLSEDTPKVSSYDAYAAVQSLLSDITSFCDRNEETCLTGKSIATNTMNSIQNGIQSISRENTDAEFKQDAEPKDSITTGTIQKNNTN